MLFDTYYAFFLLTTLLYLHISFNMFTGWFLSFSLFDFMSFAVYKVTFVRKHLTESGSVITWNYLLHIFLFTQTENTNSMAAVWVDSIQFMCHHCSSRTHTDSIWRFQRSVWRSPNFRSLLEWRATLFTTLIMLSVLVD